MIKNIVFPGSFDLFTKGHLWVAQEAAKLPEYKLHVVIGTNPNKKGMFAIEQRVEMIEAALHEGGVHYFDVNVLEGEYTAEYAEYLDAYMVRGIRSAADLEYEKVVNHTNTVVLGARQTLFLVPPDDVAMISSSYVKSLVGPIGWQYHVKKFLPNASYNMLLRQWLREQWSKAISDLRIQQWPYQDDIGIRETVLNRYAGEDRHYHNMAHLVHGISEFARTDLDDIDRGRLVLAFMYHDYFNGIDQQMVGYTNERRSEMRMCEDLHGIIDQEHIVKISKLIMVTEHSSRDSTMKLDYMEGIMLSADLAILGRPHAEYDEYAHGIRMEYSTVPRVDYFVERCKVLDSMLQLARKDLLIPHFAYSHYNSTAVWNMMREKSKMENILDPSSSQLQEID